MRAGRGRGVQISGGGERRGDWFDCDGRWMDGGDWWGQRSNQKFCQGVQTGGCSYPLDVILKIKKRLLSHGLVYVGKIFDIVKEGWCPPHHTWLLVLWFRVADWLVPLHKIHFSTFSRTHLV